MMQVYNSIPSSYLPSSEDYNGYLQPVSENNFSAQQGKYVSAWNRLPRDIYWKESDFYKNLYKNLVSNLTLTIEEATDVYWNYPTQHSYGGFEYPVEAMQGVGEAKRHRKADATLEKSMGRLLGILDLPTRLNLHASHLDLDPACENPKLFYSPDNIKLWRDAIELYVPLPYYCKLQVGWHFGENRIHPHIISSKPEGKLADIESERVAKQLYDATGFVEYLQNTGLPWNPRNLNIRIGAERERNEKRREISKRVALPRTAWFSKGLPNSRTWRKHEA
jgi:hypothetical protein